MVAGLRAGGMQSQHRGMYTVQLDSPNRSPTLAVASKLAIESGRTPV
jgi:hypothetical protein